jgi:hypothetical protein
MPTNTTVLIVVTALAVLALAGVLVWVTYKTRAPQRHSTDTTTCDDVETIAQAAEVEIEIKTIRACSRDNNRMSIATRRPRPPAIH